MGRRIRWEAIMRAYIVIAALGVLAVSARLDAADNEDRTSVGLSCAVDCSGYDAGYKWAKQRDIDDEDYCPDGDKSFYEGCVAYVAEPFGPLPEPITARAFQLL